jgi:hypothetical protein
LTETWFEVELKTRLPHHQRTGICASQKIQMIGSLFPVNAPPKKIIYEQKS